MSLFPSAKEEGVEVVEESQQPSTAFTSFDLIRQNERRAERERAQRIRNRVEEIKDQNAIRKFSHRDDDSDEDIIELIDSDDEAAAQAMAKPAVDSLRYMNSRYNQSKQNDEIRKKAIARGVIRPPERKRKRSRSPSSDSSSSSSSSTTSSSSAMSICSGDEVRSARRKTKRKKEEKKAKKRAKKERKREKKRIKKLAKQVEPKQLLGSREKWCFIRPEEIVFDSGNYLVIHRFFDGELRAYDHVSAKGEKVVYSLRYVSTLGGNKIINDIMFPEREKLIAKGRELRRYYQTNVKASSRPEKFFVRRTEEEKTAERREGFITLSRVPLASTLATTYGHDGSVLGELTKVHDVEANAVDDPSARRQLLNTKLSRDPKNIDLWCAFIELEEQIQKTEVSANPHAGFRDAQHERKMSIVDSAIKNNPRCARLLRLRMKFMKERWSKEQLLKEWKRMTQTHAQSLELWKEYLDMISGDQVHFEMEKFENSLSQCEETIWSILHGRLVSHKSEPGSEFFLVQMLERRVELLLHAGHTEKAISLIQATLEMNMHDVKGNAALEFKRVFDESFCPLIGEPGATGFVDAMSKPDHSSNEAAAEDEEMMKEEERRIGLTESNENVMWLELHRARANHQWWPIRPAFHAKDPVDAARIVDSSDVILPLTHCPREFPLSARFLLATALLSKLGAQFYERQEDSLEALLATEFPIFTQLPRRPASLRLFIDRALSLLSVKVPNWSSEASLTMARIKTAVHLIALEKPVDLVKAARKYMDGLQSELLARSSGMSPLICCLLALLEELSKHLLLASKDQGPGTSREEWWKSIDFIRVAIFAANAKKKKKNTGGGEGGEQRVEGCLLHTLSRDNLELMLMLMATACKMCTTTTEISQVIGCLVRNEKVFSLEMTPTKEIQTMQHLVAVQNHILATGPKPTHEYVQFLSERVLGNALGNIAVALMYAEYATSSLRGEARITGPREHSVKAYMAVSEQETTTKRILLEQLLRILKMDKRDTSNNTSINQFMENIVEKDNNPLNWSPYVLKSWIETKSCGATALRMLTTLRQLAEKTPSLKYSAARIYSAYLASNRRLDRADSEYDRNSAFGVLKVLREEADRLKHPLLWRYALNLAIFYGQTRLIEEVHTAASSQCVWARDIHLDYAEKFPDKMDEMENLAVEKGLSCRATLEEAKVLAKYRQEHQQQPTEGDREDD